MTNYSRGRTFEWAVRDDLKANGYEFIRSAGSKGKIDLVAFKPGQCCFVQAKINGLCPPAERRELRRLAGLINAVPLVAHKVPGGVGYRRLTGDGPKDYVAWVVDEVAA